MVDNSKGAIGAFGILLDLVLCHKAAEVTMQYNGDNRRVKQTD